MKNIDEKLIYEAAKKRIGKIKEFYIHVFIYILVNTIILYSNYQSLDSTESFFEFRNFSTVVFWGIGLVAHGLSLFSLDLILGKGWEDQKIKELMGKDKDLFV